MNGKINAIMDKMKQCAESGVDYVKYGILGQDYVWDGKELLGNKKGYIKNLVVADGVEYVDATLLDGCKSLKSVTIPESVRDFNHYTYKAGEDYGKEESGIEGYGDYTRTNDEMLSLVNLPALKKINVIGSYNADRQKDVDKAFNCSYRQGVSADYNRNVDISFVQPDLSKNQQFQNSRIADMTFASSGSNKDKQFD